MYTLWTLPIYLPITRFSCHGGYPNAIARAPHRQADPELFQFGNHWPLFLELARRALDSVNPAVHAKVLLLYCCRTLYRSIAFSGTDMMVTPTPGPYGTTDYRYGYG